jgi:hypothetical protein
MKAWIRAFVARHLIADDPAPAPSRLDAPDALVASAWGFTEAEWLALNDQQRSDRRATYTKAPRYVR